MHGGVTVFVLLISWIRLAVRGKTREIERLDDSGWIFCHWC